MNKKTFHSIVIDKKKCVGCVICMKACPTKAIRLKDGKAKIIDELCVDCGECYRVCPYDAVVPQNTSFSDLQQFKFTVALPSPVLFTQFGWEVMPNQVLLALLKIGFDYVYDIAWMCEKVNAAYDEYLRRNLVPRPKISTVCPAVVRIVACLYPDLVNHIIPVESPRELAAANLRKKLSREKGLDPSDIGIIHISSCPAKLISINRPMGIKKSNLDGAISIRDIYGLLLKEIDEVEEEFILHQSSGVGLGWAMSGGELNGISHDNCLAVSGVKDVIQILDDVEAGKLRGVEYLECLICPDGCLGGPQVVENRHMAKKRAEMLVKMFGEKSRVSRKMVRRLYGEGYFTLEEGIKVKPFPPLDSHPAKAIEKRRLMEEIIPKLGGKECGACGAPDCRTLARDIVTGQAKMEDCVFVKIENLNKGDEDDAE